MHLLNRPADTAVKSKLKQALEIIERIEKQSIPEPIDLDCLLETLRQAYTKAYEIGWEKAEQVEIVTEENIAKEKESKQIESETTTILPEKEPVEILLSNAEEPEPEQSPVVEKKEEIPVATSLEKAEEVKAPVASSAVAPLSISSEQEISKHEHSLKPTTHLPPISDLRSALSINDKFLLANKLFKGNGTDFNLSLNVLNGFSSFGEAKNYLDTLSQQNNWDTEGSEYLLLLGLVERRYYR